MVPAILQFFFRFQDMFQNNLHSNGAFLFRKKAVKIWAGDGISKIPSPVLHTRYTRVIVYQLCISRAIEHILKRNKNSSITSTVLQLEIQAFA